MPKDVVWYNKASSEKEKKAALAETAAKYPRPKEYAAGSMEAVSSSNPLQKKAPRKKKK